MESWQKVHIDSNLPDLQKMTQCNSQLFSILRKEGVLGDGDIDTLESEKEKLAQSSLLYKILKTRLNGFEKITNALHQCRQSGALRILLMGFKESGIYNPLAHCGISCEWKDMLSTEVQVQDNKLKFEDLFKYIQEEDMRVIMDDNACESDYIDIFFYKREPFRLVEHTLPPPHPLYIPREISNRLKLHSDVFKHPCTDIFVFTGMDRVKLSELVYPNTTSTSTDQLHSLTSRFILLKEYPDWDIIKALADEEFKPAHLVKFENNSSTDLGAKDSTSYILEDTVTYSTTLWQYVKKQEPTDRVYISEKELVEKISGDHGAPGFCICDTPGMGKSYLLASLARQVSKKCPDKIVVFIPLAKFVPSVGGRSTSSNMSRDSALRIIIKHISPTKLSQSILLHAVNKGNAWMDLFFDGLDEVAVDHMEWTLRFLSGLKENNPNVKIYVTSRPQLRQDLEKTLGVIAYDILPFTEANQLEYLKTKWHQDVPNGDETRLKPFAVTCLNNLKNTFSEGERDIMGIPLQCYLLAEVYKRQVALYSDKKRKIKIPKIEPTTLFLMYKNYVEFRFEKDEKSDHVRSKSELESLKRIHVWMALKLLFPEVAVHYARYHHIDLHNVHTDILSFGILIGSAEVDNIELDFIHRTVAEFLVSDYFAHVLMTQINDDSDVSPLHALVIEYIAITVLQGVEKDWQKFIIGKFAGEKSPAFPVSRFQYTVIAYFLNEELKTIPNPLNRSLASTFFKSLNPENMYELLQCAIVGNYLNLFRYLKELLLQLDETSQHVHQNYLLMETTSERFVKGVSVAPVCLLFCTASQYSSVDLVMECFRFFPDGLRKMCSDMANNVMTPLHWALKRGNYELLEFLEDKFELENRELIYFCIERSYGEHNDLAEKRQDMCEYLLNINKDLLYEEGMSYGWKCTGPLAEWRVHSKLIKYLIEMGADLDASRNRVRAGEDIQRTFLETASKYMDPDDFQELCVSLITIHRKTELFRQMNSKQLSPINYILRYQKVDPKFIRTILDVDSVNIHEKGEEYNENAILSAIRGNQNVEVIKELVRAKLDCRYKNDGGESGLHLAAQGGNLETIKYLLSQGLSVYLRDNDGNPPLLRSWFHLDVSKYFLAQGANPLDQDNNGNTYASIAAMELHADNFHAVVELLLDYDAKGRIFKEANRQGKTPLHLRLGNFEQDVHPHTLTLLLNIPGLDKNLQDGEGNTFFLLAVNSNKKENILKMLTCYDVSYHIRNVSGKNSLDIAAEKQNIDVVNYLIFIDREDDLLEKEVTTERIVRKLKEVYNNSDPKLDACIKLLEIYLALCPESHDENRGNEPIGMNGLWLNMMSERNFHSLLVRILGSAQGLSLREKEVVEARSPVRRSRSVCSESADVPTSVAAPKGNVFCGVSLFKSFLEIPLDLIGQDEVGNTLIHRLPECFTAEEYHHVVKYLIDNRHDRAFQMKNNQGRTPIHAALNSLELMPKTMDLLFGVNRLSGSAETTPCGNVNEVDENGDSVLHWALKGNRSLGCIKHLVSLNADCKTQNKEGANLAHTAASIGLIGHLRYFIELGCDINEVDRNGDNVLQCTVKYANKYLFEMVDLLVSRNVDKGNVNADGKTAFDIGNEKGTVYVKIRDLLV